MIWAQAPAPSSVTNAIMTANGSRSPCPAWRKKVQTREQSSSPSAVCRAGLKNEHPSLTQPHAVHNVFLSSVQHGWRCSHWSFASFQDSSPCDVCSVFQIFWSHMMSVAKPNVLFYHKDHHTVTALTVDACIQICHVSSVKPNAVDSDYMTWQI